jgi:hypothetical protein
MMTGPYFTYKLISPEEQGRRVLRMATRWTLALLSGSRQEMGHGRATSIDEMGLEKALYTPQGNRKANCAPAGADASYCTGVYGGHLLSQ